MQVDCGADEATVKVYFAQLLAGAAHCHDRCVAHRDLKPENLLLADHSDTPVLKIADFGFSALMLPEVSSRSLTHQCRLHVPLRKSSVTLTVPKELAAVQRS